MVAAMLSTITAPSAFRPARVAAPRPVSRARFSPIVRSVRRPLILRHDPDRAKRHVSRRS